MKYLESFFFNRKLTQDNTEDIEDIFESYLDKTFFKGGQFALSADPRRLNTYAFIPQEAIVPCKCLSIEIWSPGDKLILDIFDRFKKRIKKFGFESRIRTRLDAMTIEDDEDGGWWVVYKSKISVTR